MHGGGRGLVTEHVELPAVPSHWPWIARSVSFAGLRPSTLAGIVMLYALIAATAVGTPIVPASWIVPASVPSLTSRRPNTASSCFAGTSGGGSPTAGSFATAIVPVSAAVRRSSREQVIARQRRVEVEREQRHRACLHATGGLCAVRIDRRLEVRIDRLLQRAAFQAANVELHAAAAARRLEVRVEVDRRVIRRLASELRDHLRRDRDVVRLERAAEQRAGAERAPRRGIEQVVRKLRVDRAAACDDPDELCRDAGIDRAALAGERDIALGDAVPSSGSRAGERCRSSPCRSARPRQ